MADPKPIPPVTDKTPGTAARFLEVALSQVGVIEGPKDNETPYGAFTGANFQPWCGSFMMWCAHNSGVTIPNTVYTPNGAAAFKKAGTWADAATAHPQPGDLIYFSFVPNATPSSPIQHVGVVLKDNGDGTITTVEGNTSPDLKPKGSLITAEKSLLTSVATRPITHVTSGLLWSDLADQPMQEPPLTHTQQHQPLKQSHRSQERLNQAIQVLTCPPSRQPFI